MVKLGLHLVEWKKIKVLMMFLIFPEDKEMKNINSLKIVRQSKEKNV